MADTMTNEEAQRLRAVVIELIRSTYGPEQMRGDPECPPNEVQEVVAAINKLTAAASSPSVEVAQEAVELTITGHAEALAKFDAYFAKNYPGPDTIINDPHWHAPRIFRAVLHFLISSQPPPVSSAPTRDSVIEECAKVCDDYADSLLPTNLVYMTAVDLAKRIRSLLQPSVPPVDIGKDGDT